MYKEEEPSEMASPPIEDCRMCWKNPVPWSHLSRRFEGPRTLEGQRLAALAPCSLKVETASPYLASFLSLAESFRGGMDRPPQAAAILLRMRK